MTNADKIKIIRELKESGTTNEDVIGYAAFQIGAEELSRKRTHKANSLDAEEEFRKLPSASLEHTLELFGTMAANMRFVEGMAEKFKEKGYLEKIYDRLIELFKNGDQESARDRMIDRTTRK